MQSAKKLDMTVGKPLKLIILFAIPIFLGNMFQQLYNLVDATIVSKTLGDNAYNGLNSTMSLSFLVIGFIIGLTAGLSVITAQNYGAKNEEGIRKSIATSFVICAALTVVLTLVSCLLAKPILRAMKTDPAAFDDAYKYIIVIFAGTGATMFYNILASIIRSLGDSRAPFIFLVIASVLNIALDFLFILVFKTGVEGAAYATVISQLVSAVLCLIFMYKKYGKYMPRRADFKITKVSVWQHISVSLPMGLQMSVMTIGMLVLQSVVNSYGLVTISGYSSAVRIDQLAMQPMVSLGVASATYVAQNYGAKKLDRIREGVRKCMFVSLIVSVVCFLIIFLLGKYLLLLFLSPENKEAIEIASNYLNISTAFYPFLAILFLYRNTLQGMGKPLFPLISCGIELSVRIVVAITFSAAFGFFGVIFTSPLSWASTAIMLMLSYVFIVAKMRRKHIFENEPIPQPQLEQQQDVRIDA